MKKSFILSIVTFLAFSLVFFSGCFSDKKDKSKDSDSEVTQAEDVTIDDLKREFGSLSGTGSAPDSDASVTNTVEQIGDAEEVIEDAIADVIDFEKSKFKKSMKKRIIKRNKSSKESDSDSGSWDEEGSVNLAYEDGFDSGTVYYSTKGSYSWSESESQKSDNLVEWDSEEFYKENLKVKLTDVKPAGVDITMNALMNQNARQDYKEGGLYNILEDRLVELEIDEEFDLSYRSGYAISGSILKCYVVVSLDCGVSIDEFFSESELAGKTEEQIEDLVDSAYTFTGSMKIQVYDADGKIVFTKTLSGNELRAFMESEDDEDYEKK